MKSKLAVLLVIILFCALFFLIGLIIFQFKNPGEDIYDDALKKGKILEILNYK